MHCTQAILFLSRKACLCRCSFGWTLGGSLTLFLNLLLAYLNNLLQAFLVVGRVEKKMLATKIVMKIAKCQAVVSVLISWF